MSYGTTTRQRIRKLLRKLGPSAKAVYRSLKRKKIVGYQQLADACPISNYLRQHLDCSKVRITKVGDGPSYATAYMMGQILFSVKCPKPVNKFIGKFDSGKFKKVCCG